MTIWQARLKWKTMSMSEPMFPIEEAPPKFKNMPKTRVFVAQSWKNIWYALPRIVVKMTS